MLTNCGDNPYDTPLKKRQSGGFSSIKRTLAD